MATVSIQVPMLETKLPAQTVANARCRNGRKGDTRVGWAGLVTGPGYPGRTGPARGLLQGGPEGLAALGDAAQPPGAHRAPPAGAPGGPPPPGRPPPPRGRGGGGGPRG